MKELIEKRYGLKLKELETSEHEIGKTYFCDYWSKTYKCIDIVESEIWGKVYVCVWEDGHITKHATRLIKGRDYEVITKQEKEGN